jgi:hypothetical protein
MLHAAAFLVEYWPAVHVCTMQLVLAPASECLQALQFLIICIFCCFYICWFLILRITLVFFDVFTSDFYELLISQFKHLSIIEWALNYFEYCPERHYWLVELAFEPKPEYLPAQQSRQPSELEVVPTFVEYWSAGHSCVIQVVFDLAPIKCLEHSCLSRRFSKSLILMFISAKWGSSGRSSLFYSLRWTIFLIYRIHIHLL